MSKIMVKGKKVVHTFETYISHRVPGVGLFQGGDGHTDLMFGCLKAINRHYTGKDECPDEASEEHKEAHRRLHASQRAPAMGVVYSDGTVRIIPLL